MVDPLRSSGSPQFAEPIINPDEEPLPFDDAPSDTEEEDDMEERFWLDMDDDPEEVHDGS